MRNQDYYHNNMRIHFTDSKLHFEAAWKNARIILNDNVLYAGILMGAIPFILPKESLNQLPLPFKMTLNLADSISNATVNKIDAFTSPKPQFGNADSMTHQANILKPALNTVLYSAGIMVAGILVSALSDPFGNGAAMVKAGKDCALETAQGTYDLAAGLISATEYVACATYNTAESIILGDDAFESVVDHIIESA